MAEDITYLGVEPEAPTIQRKSKKDKSSKDTEKFKINKHSSKLNRQIANTKKFIINKKVILFLIIILLLYFFNPITFLRAKLDEKRQFYAADEKYVFNLNYTGGWWNSFVYATGKDYYCGAKGTMVRPADGYINNQYEVYHRGIDIVSEVYPGTAYAAQSGTVVSVTYDKKMKNEILIQHEINGLTLYTYYANLAQVYVAEGQFVSQNTPLGLEDGTPSKDGDFDTKVHHVHFEVRKDPKPKSAMNPAVFILL